MDVCPQPDTKPFVTVEGLSKAFRSDYGESSGDVVLQDMRLSLNAGELCTVFGPNGCGKTTLLNLLAGLSKPDAGAIAIGGREPTPGLAAYMFQNFKDSLYPWRTVEGNLLFPLECKIRSKAEQINRLRDFLKVFALPIPLRARVYELSVGQQQMVALARALITQPRFVLMDEPFSALDFHTRRCMQERLLSYWQDTGSTILVVSHEIDEAIYLGQRLILFPPRPVTAVREVRIQLPLPRSRDVLYTQEHFRIRSEALRFVEQDAERDE